MATMLDSCAISKPTSGRTLKVGESSFMSKHTARRSEVHAAFEGVTEKHLVPSDFTFRTVGGPFQDIMIAPTSLSRIKLYGVQDYNFKPVAAKKSLLALPKQSHFTSSVARIRVPEARDIDLRLILPLRKVTTHSCIKGGRLRLWPAAIQPSKVAETRE